jgi:hypothetical protein
MTQVLISKIQVRRGQELQTGIPRMDPGEFAWAEDTEHLYIGKRISEGAVDDENTRILTENDLSNIFTLVRSPGNVAATSSYKYRSDTPYINATSSTIATKLDNWVSLTDYWQPLESSMLLSQGVDITIQLTNAIQDLYFNSSYSSVNRSDAHRKLIIPAGIYTISSTIDLPPYTSLIGEGSGLTTIIFNPSGNSQPMFQTVDARGNGFYSDIMDVSVQDGQNAKSINISGMSLQFNSANTYTAILVSLDQVVDVELTDVDFRTANLSTSTIYGCAIRLQSTPIDGSLVDGAPAGNIKINRCNFQNLQTAISQTVGTINRFFITNSTFSYLRCGISMWSFDVNNPGPVNGLIDSNRFERISNQAIVLGTSTYTAFPSYTIISNNTFRGVGNGVSNLSLNPISEYTNKAGGPIIQFNSSGNRSINDSFASRDFADLITQEMGNDFYFNPLVVGPALIQDDATRRKKLTLTSNNITTFPLTGGEQSITIQYELWNSKTGYSRKGKLLVNIIGIDPAGNYPAYINRDQIGSVSDYYNYSYVTTVDDANWAVESSGAGTYNYVTLQLNGFTPNDVDPSFNGPYYLDYQVTIIT